MPNEQKIRFQEIAHLFLAPTLNFRILSENFIFISRSYSIFGVLLHLLID